MTQDSLYEELEQMFCHVPGVRYDNAPDHHSWPLYLVHNSDIFD